MQADEFKKNYKDFHNEYTNPELRQRIYTSITDILPGLKTEITKGNGDFNDQLGKHQLVEINAGLDLWTEETEKLAEEYEEKRVQWLEANNKAFKFERAYYNHTVVGNVHRLFKWVKHNVVQQK